MVSPNTHPPTSPSLVTWDPGSVAPLCPVAVSVALFKSTSLDHTTSIKTLFSRFLVENLFNLIENLGSSGL